MLSVKFSVSSNQILSFEMEEEMLALPFCIFAIVSYETEVTVLKTIKTTT